jgi:predicted dehydrogenase
MHIETALAAAEAGCDLFVEKPLAASMDGVNELIAAATEKKLIAMVGYQMRFHPCIMAAREALAEKTVGSPVSVRAAVGEFMPNFHHYEDYRSTYAARKHLGGGVMLSQIHEFDYLYSFFGAPKRIYAVGGHWSSLEIDVEDTASVLMECEVDGRPLPVHLHQDFLQNPPSRRCEIIATSGTIVLDFATLSVVISNRDSGELVTRNFAQYDRNTPFLDEMQHFLGCAKDRRKPVVDLAEGAQSLRTVLAAKRSMEEKRVIELSGPFLQ